jgi:hypothetical protein
MSQSKKRPLTDTQSHSPPQHRKARVDEDADFTLFDQGEVLDTVDWSLFDGQLSELTKPSDAGSAFPPSTASVSESEWGLDNQDKANAALTSPSGNWEGVRKPQNAYMLQGAGEDLTGPDVEVLDMQAVKLTNEEKNVTRKFTQYLVRNWPGDRLNADLAASRNLTLADPTAFWGSLFMPEFKKFIDYLENTPAGNRSSEVSGLTQNDPYAQYHMLLAD